MKNPHFMRNIYLSLRSLWAGLLCFALLVGPAVAGTDPGAESILDKLVKLIPCPNWTVAVSRFIAHSGFDRAIDTHQRSNE